MKMPCAIFALLVGNAAMAQAPVTAQPDAKSVESVKLPSGWILVIPAEKAGTTGYQNWVFDAPKDTEVWAAQRPAGVPVVTDGSYLFAPGPSTGTQRPVAGQTVEDLIAKQTAAISYLAERIDKLEARLKEFEARDGAQK